MTVELRPYIEGLRARREAERRAAEERAATANVVARRCAEHLRGRFGVTRVILFGSLARGEFHSTSDIDLAVEGLPPDQLFRAGADLAKIAGEIEVGLVPLEQASPGLRAEIRDEGVELP
jgi:predicted nucleotidyltransferase